MMILKVKNKKMLKKSEIFFFLSLSLFDTGFSSNNFYLKYKSRYKNLSLVTANTKSLNLKLKLSRFDIKNMTNNGFLIGYYRALW
jgi:ribosomal protein S14